MKIHHEPGRFLALEHAGVERLRYDYSTAPKPFCHPIRTADGRVVTLCSPADHTWHRGLWFAWKFVDGVNYWEERDAIVGHQVTLAPPEIESLDEDTVRWTSDIAWRDNGDGPTRLMERRVVTATALPDGTLRLDWDIAQTPPDDADDVTLDRTPFTTWGGYGGLFVRALSPIEAQHVLFDDGEKTTRPTGQPHRAAAIQGDDFAFVFLPSPTTNPRFPEPFYGNARPDSNFFGPAPLFHAPLTIARGDTLRHRYRVLVVPRLVDAPTLAGYYRDWADAENTDAR